MNGLPTHIAVLGGGPLAKLAAISLHRSLPRAAITRFVQPQQGHSLGEALGLASNDLLHVHRLIGLPDAVFARRCSAQPLAERAVTGTAGWPSGGLALGAGPVPYAQGVAVHQDVLARGLDGGRWTATARRLRDDARFGLAAAAHLYDPASYDQLLSEIELACPIRIESAAMPLPSDAPLQMRSTDGAMVAADLLVDAGTALSPWLIAQGAATEAISWFATGFDVMADRGQTLPSGQDALQRTEDRLHWQGQGRSYILVKSHQATAHHAARLDRPRLAGMVAIGAAALWLPLLDGHAFGAGLRDLIRLLDLLPAVPDPAPIVQEYVRQTRREQDWLIQWAVAQWGEASAANESPDPFTEPVAAAWQRRGRIPFRDGDPVSDAEWLDWLMIIAQKPLYTDPVAIAANRIFQKTGERV